MRSQPEPMHASSRGDGRAQTGRLALGEMARCAKMIAAHTQLMTLFICNHFSAGGPREGLLSLDSAMKTQQFTSARS
jgi:hypothetical protein